MLLKKVIIFLICVLSKELIVKITNNYFKEILKELRANAKESISVSFSMESFWVSGTTTAI